MFYRGDPNKSDIWGNTPLHHAAANGHMHIISFLVNFGANLFALDNDFHTAMDVAASRGHMDCVRFLDDAASQQTNKNPKRVANIKKEAQKEAERRVKLCEKVKKRHQSKMDRMHRGGSVNGSVSEARTGSPFSDGGTIGSANEKFSKLIAADKSGSVTARVKGTLQKMGKKEKGTLQRSAGDGNVIFRKTENESSDKPEFLDVFDEQDESEEPIGEMEGYEDDDTRDEPGQVKQSIFNRPGFGGLIFMKKMNMETEDTVPTGNNETLGFLVENQLFEADEDAAGFGEAGDGDLPWDQEDLGLDDDEDEENSPLEVFLSTISLPEFAPAFKREHLDLEALILCSDDDLKGIRIQLGIRKKILEAVARRTKAMDNPGTMKDSSL